MAVNSQERDPARQLLFDHICSTGMEFDTVFEYEALEQLTGKPRHWVYGAIAWVNRRLHKDHLRHLQVIPRRGYRVVKPEEHSGASLRELRKADRRTRRAQQIVTCADVARMSPADQRKHDMLCGAIVALARDTQANTRAIVRLQKVQESHSVVQGVHQAEIERLREEIEELKRSRGS